MSHNIVTQTEYKSFQSTERLNIDWFNINYYELKKVVSLMSLKLKNTNKHNVKN